MCKDFDLEMHTLNSFVEDLENFRAQARVFLKTHFIVQADGSVIVVDRPRTEKVQAKFLQKLHARNFEHATRAPTP